MAKTIIADPPVKARPSVDLDTLLSIHPELLDKLEGRFQTQFRFVELA